MQGQGCCVFLGRQRSSKTSIISCFFLFSSPCSLPRIALFLFHLEVGWITAQFIHAPVCIYEHYQGLWAKDTVNHTKGTERLWARYWPHYGVKLLAPCLAPRMYKAALTGAAHCLTIQYFSLRPSFKAEFSNWQPAPITCVYVSVCVWNPDTFSVLVMGVGVGDCEISLRGKSTLFESKCWTLFSPTLGLDSEPQNFLIPTKCDHSSQLNLLLNGLWSLKPFSWGSSCFYI